MGTLHRMLAASRKYTAAGGGAPAYKSAGGIVESVFLDSSVTTAYPASVSANDVAILILVGQGLSVSTWPTGFSLLVSYTNGKNTAIAWKRCSGSEGGTNVTTSYSISFFQTAVAQIFVFSDCVTSGAPYEACTTATTLYGDSTVNHTSITTTGSNRLGIHLFSAWGSTVNSTPAATWTKRSDSTNSKSVQVVVESKTIASASTEAAVTTDLGSSAVWSTASFALIGT